jgi:DNA replication protein DnaC
LAKSPRYRPFPCEEEGPCSHPAAGSLDGRRLCAEHLALRQQALEREKGEGGPPPLPPAPDLGDCETCRRRRYVLETVDGYARALSCPSCSAPCGVCKGAGEILLEDGVGRRWAKACYCKERAIRRRLFDAAKIPGLYTPLLLGPLEPPAGYTPSESQRAAAATVEAWAKAYKPRARGLLLHGPIGTSKTTHLARALAYLTLSLGVQARFVEWSILLKEEKETFDTKERSPLLPLYRIPVLAVDEVGKQAPTEWQERELDQLLSARYQGGHTTLIATNCIPRGARLYPGAVELSSRIGARLYDRLVERCDFLEVTGASVRAHLGKKTRGPRGGGRP